MKITKSMKSSKKKILYLGLDPSRYPRKVVHYPIIQTIPRPFEAPEIQEAFRLFPSYTHLLFTSRTAVKITLEYGKRAGVDFSDKKIIAIGKATAALLDRVDLIASNEHAEGVVEELEKLDLLAHISHQHSSRFGQSVLPNDKERPEGRVKLTLPRDYLKSDGDTDGQSGRTVGEKCGLGAHFFFPRSSLARPVIGDFFLREKIDHIAPVLYETRPNLSLEPIEVESFEEIVFTSPSTVRAFLSILGPLPREKKLIALGPVTQKELDRYVQHPYLRRNQQGEDYGTKIYSSRTDI